MESESQRKASAIIGNSVVLLTNIMSLYIENLLDRLKGRGTELRYEKKKCFNDMIHSLKGFQRAYESMDQYIWECAGNSKNYDEWLEDANFVARLLLLYADRFAWNEKAKSELYDFMYKKKSMGAISDADLDNFRLK